MTAAGGAAPAVITCTGRCGLRRTSSGAFTSMPITMGAPHMWVTPWSAMASYIPLGVTARRQTCVPAIAVTVQGKHQPLQWNIGSVHR